VTVALRTPLKWFAYGVALLPLLAVIGPIAEAVGPVASALVFPVLVSGIPVAIGVAVLRYRLYDIDHIINRTLVYGLLAATLGAVYAGIVLVLGEVSGGISDEPPTWAIAGATLAAAALVPAGPPSHSDRGRPPLQPAQAQRSQDHRGLLHPPTRPDRPRHPLDRAAGSH
jgi:hypothetical protein